MTVGRFATAANEVTVGGFWTKHAKSEQEGVRDFEILESRSS